MKQEYFSKHLSLSQWAIQANISNKEDLIKEDATKRHRLSFLNKTIGLPVVEVYSFNYIDLRDTSASLLSFLEMAGDRLYALRANPKEEGLPVLRNRKLRVRELVDWILSSDIEFEKYDYNFELHIDPEIASIFIVSTNRIVGEVISGGILQLNKGLHSETASTYFQYDFNAWKFSDNSTFVGDFLQRAIQFILIKDADKKKIIEDELNGSFTEDYLQGYFEVISSADSGIIFIDYNRILKNNVDGLELFSKKITSEEIELTGQVGCAGKVSGKARVVIDQDIQGISLNPDEILVCHFTSPEFVPLMTQAAAVVTDVGGILSHAAIVCRELKKPCVIGTKVGTQRIKTGDYIEVDAMHGVVKLL